MKPAVLQLAAAMLLACFCNSSPAAAAAGAPGRVLAGRPGRDRPRQQQRDKTWLEVSASAATMEITAVYDSVTQVVTQVKAKAEFEYCDKNPGKTKCSIDSGLCKGKFSTNDPCQAWPQFNYAPCGAQLKVPKRQQVSPAGGFDIWLDMRTVSEKAACMIARRSSRRMLQDPLNETLKPLIAIRPPIWDAGQQTDADSTILIVNKPTGDEPPAPDPPKPELLDSPKPAPGFEDSPKPDPPMESPDPNTKPLPSPWPWVWDSPKLYPPMDPPPPVPLESPGIYPDVKPGYSPIWWYVLPPAEDGGNTKPDLLPSDINDSPLPAPLEKPYDKETDVPPSPEVWIMTPRLPDGTGTGTGDGFNNPIWLRPAPLPTPPFIPGTDGDTTGTEGGGKAGEETTEEQEEEELENRTDWPPGTFLSPTAVGGNTNSGTEGASNKNFKLKYEGGACMVRMRFAQSAGVVQGDGGCACFQGKTRAVMGAKAMHAVAAGGVQPVFSRWKCKGLVAIACSPNECSL